MHIIFREKRKNDKLRSTLIHNGSNNKFKRGISGRAIYKMKVVVTGATGHIGNVLVRDIEETIRDTIEWYKKRGEIK